MSTHSCRVNNLTGGMGFTFRYTLWLMILSLLVICFLQYGTYLTSVKERRPVQIHRFPDMHIWFSDLSFDFDSRSITYDFQFQIWTGTSQREIYFSFSSYMAPGFTFTGTIDPSNLPSKYYQVNRKSTADKVYGMSELYPYDSYRVTYDVYGYASSRLDFDEHFVPRVFAYMKYPESMYWQIEGHATPIAQNVTSESCDVNLKVTLTISRILGYSSLVSLAIVWAGNVVLASSLFLMDNGSRGKVPSVVERLTVYISLFIFIPVFMDSISSRIPLKFLLSTAEIFLIALLLSTVAFLACSSLSRSLIPQLSWDRYAVILSIVSCPILLLINPIFYLWHKIRAGDPYMGFSDFPRVFSWFFDMRVIPWVVLVSSLYAISYAKVYHDFKESRLTILLVGVLVLYFTSFEDLHDPTLVLLAASYIAFAWKEIAYAVRGLGSQLRAPFRHPSESQLEA